MPITAVSIKGATELRAALRAAQNASPKELGAANKSAAQVVVLQALPNVPRGRSGKLAKSVRALGSQRLGRVRAGSSTVPYAAAIHWGRKQGNVGSPPGNRRGPNPIKGRPFLTDAAQKAIPRVVRVYEQAVAAIVARLKG